MSIGANKQAREARRIIEDMGLSVRDVVKGTKHLRIEIEHPQRGYCGYVSVHLGSKPDALALAGIRSNVRAMARGTYRPGAAACQ